MLTSPLAAAVQPLYARDHDKLHKNEGIEHVCAGRTSSYL